MFLWNRRILLLYKNLKGQKKWEWSSCIILYTYTVDKQFPTSPYPIHQSSAFVGNLDAPSLAAYRRRRCRRRHRRLVSAFPCRVDFQSHSDYRATRTLSHVYRRARRQNCQLKSGSEASRVLSTPEQRNAQRPQGDPVRHIGRSRALSATADASPASCRTSHRPNHPSTHPPTITLFRYIACTSHIHYILHVYMYIYI